MAAVVSKQNIEHIYRSKGGSGCSSVIQCVTNVLVVLGSTLRKHRKSTEENERGEEGKGRRVGAGRGAEKGRRGGEEQRGISGKPLTLPSQRDL